jgi:hypothetical protein
LLASLAAYEADPIVAEIRLDIATSLEHGFATLIAGAVARHRRTTLTN